MKVPLADLFLSQVEQKTFNYPSIKIDPFVIKSS